ncbi:6-phosphogluconolactonase [Actinopolymorpha sp. B11F2]|uniref:6-phosphogluconolactonase n=1 Tax=Actinopolymorpha sp. B11F2 TaxID=3160862 RepID=UPI0032E38F6A
MRVHPTVFADPSALGEALAVRIADGLEAATSAGRRYVLGCPGGRSPMTTYTALAALVRQRQLDVSGLVIAMMDDYVEPASTRPAGFAHVPDNLPHSCRRFGREVIAEPLSTAAGPGRAIPADQLWMPDPADPEDYDHKLAAAGGIDLFILATGATDGHVAFNPPGTPAGSVSRVVTLADSTRRDNLVTFPHLRSLDRVPEHGVTVGIDTIRRHSKSAVMLVHGTDKSEAAARLSTADRYDPDWPATVITECQNPALYVDKAAQSGPPHATRF